ncbi:MAG: hypothetical protein Q8O88_05340 [bacterium]|nr:hypothetical protein [bacterium]
MSGLRHGYKSKLPVSCKGLGGPAVAGIVKLHAIRELRKIELNLRDFALKPIFLLSTLNILKT